ncbi:hypothetical protein [Pedobacter steynii]
MFRLWQKALGLAHSKPEIVYVADDAGLGEYREKFANAAYLLEPRSPFEEETDNTAKVQRKIQEDNDHTSDQKLTLRARLLDFVLGDWDRHEDNWRWLAQKEKEKLPIFLFQGIEIRCFIKLQEYFHGFLTING